MFVLIKYKGISYRILFIIWKQTIRAYSAQTGDFVREFEPAQGRITGIALHPDIPYTVIGCISTGYLTFWDCHSGLITSNLVYFYLTSNITFINCNYFRMFETC